MAFPNLYERFALWLLHWHANSQHAFGQCLSIDHKQIPSPYPSRKFFVEVTL